MRHGLLVLLLATVVVNEPRWSPNGEVLYRSAGGDRMFSVRATTTPALMVGKPTELFTGNHYVSPTGSPRAQYDVTADGKRFLMVTSAPSDAASGRSRVVVVQNWHEASTRLSAHPQSR